MTVTVSTRVAVHDFRVDHALLDRLPGGFLIVGTLFLLLLAAHADGVVAVDGENSQVPGGQVLAALGAFRGAEEFFFIVIFHGPNLLGVRFIDFDVRGLSA
jgi:hypothetical protein